MATDLHCKNQHHQPTPAQCMEHYGCIYENNHLVTLLVDPADGGIVDANKAACEFYGYTLRMLRKLDLSDLSAAGEEGLHHFITSSLPGGTYNGNRVFLDRHQLSGGETLDVEVHTGLITMLGKNCIYAVIHDVSERIRSEQRLRESEERYRDLVELCPEAILVYSAGTILFANRQTGKMFGKPKEELIGRSIGDFFYEEPLVSSEYNKLKSKGSMKDRFRLGQRFVRHDGVIFDLEIAGVPIVYEEAAALQLVFRDVTESKKEIARAVKLQEQRYAAQFPLEHRADLSKLYIPAATLSGDFFLFHKLNDERVIGIIGDVTGKGIAAALCISALRVIFLNSLQDNDTPVPVLNELNRKISQHMGEDYIAACCFLFDFGSGTMTAAGAGINEFMYVPHGQECRKITVKGTPLGMFECSEFEQRSIAFCPGDRFCFYSDGMELLFNERELAQERGSLQEKFADISLQDDCTWLCLNMK